MGTFYPKISFFPSFIVETWKHEKPPQICGGFSCFQVFSSFFFLPFFCLIFSSLPLLFDILKPKKVPTGWGLWLFGEMGVGVKCLVAHDCGYPLSRYTCRATRVATDFLDFIAFCRCSSGVAPHPLKILVSHLSPPHSREVSHRNLGLKRCRATRGCRRYSCGCRATLCN